MAHNWWKKVVAVIVGAVIAYWFIDDFDPDLLKGKRVLVTGASTGIGEQMAYQYARFGASVIVTARRQHVLEKVVEKCRKLGPKEGIYDYIVADMADMASVDTVVEEAVKKLGGGLDVLVLNHIMQHALAAWTGSTHDRILLSNLLDVNLRSYIHLASAAMPFLRESSAAGGSVIVMSSMAGKLGTPFVAAYSATKFALFGFFSALRNEMLMLTDPPPFTITISTIGLVGTPNALSQLQAFNNGLLDKIQPEDPAYVALEVIKAGALGRREVFIPYLYTKPMCLIRDWFPQLVDYLLRYFQGHPALSSSSSSSSSPESSSAATAEEEGG